MALWRKINELKGAISQQAGMIFRGLRSDGLPAALGGASPGTNTAVFTMAVVALGAKMAKADGVVAEIEVAAFHRAFRVDASEARNVERLFNLAKQDVAGFEAYADKIKTLLGNDRSTLQDVLESLFHIATADRAMHPGEDAFLATVGNRFGFSPSEFRHIRAQFVVDHTSPYDVLGLTPSASIDDIKKRHRDLVKETHPDRLIARGAHIELIEVATRKMQAINTAYEAIARERRI